MAEKFQQVRDIFIAALEQPIEKRSSYVAELCGADGHLREQVELLLAAHCEGQGPLDRPLPPGVLTVELPPPVRPGTKIGPYKLLQEIGEGGMGVVFMAEQHEPVKRRVALKIIKPGMDSLQVVSRFEAERQALSLMDHPHIAKVLDAGLTEQGRPYFVMELVKGQPITEYCDEHQLTPRQRLELLLPVCHAIQHAHQKGIIHRDIKPSNVLVAEYDQKAVPKVIDFGVAKAIGQPLTEDTLFTGLGQIVGTLEYMSPEQAKLNQLDIDTRSDIYSLGVLMYELLTGTTPFDRQRLRLAAWDELLRIIREEEPPKPSTRLSISGQLQAISAKRQTERTKLARLIRGDLDWITMKALDKSRDRRYASANDLAADIQRFLQQQAVLACPPSLGYKFRKFAYRNKGLLAAAAALTIAVLTGLVGTTWQAVRATQAERQARASQQRAISNERAALRERDEKETARRSAVASEAQAIAAILAERHAKEAETQARTRAEAAEKKTAEEAAVAQSVNQFLQHDLLEMADARWQVAATLTPDPDVKLRTLLDRAAHKLDERFANQPQVRWELKKTLAHVYYGLGRYDDSRRHWESVRNHYEQTEGPEHPSTIESMLHLAQSYFPGPNAERLALAELTLERCQKVLGPEHELTQWALNDLSVYYAWHRHYDRALELANQSLQLARRIHGEDQAETATTMLNVAFPMLHLGQVEEARKLCDRANEIRTSLLGPDHPKVLRGLTTQLIVLTASGQWPRAIALGDSLLAAHRRIYGDEHLSTVVTALSQVDRCWWLETSESSTLKSADMQAVDLHASRSRALAVKDLEVDFQHAAWLLVRLTNSTSAFCGVCVIWVLLFSGRSPDAGVFEGVSSGRAGRVRRRPEHARGRAPVSGLEILGASDQAAAAGDRPGRAAGDA
jgi:eukaryotic-like serine/threonine-protein kinase